jgi:NAD(P)-dependent dehydrogenase (short-subunit alcohol dehydrogenase family)
MTSLKDKVAIITGASSGIGRATALLFAREGASLVLNARGLPVSNVLRRKLQRSAGRRIVSPVTFRARKPIWNLSRQRRINSAASMSQSTNAGTVGPIAPLAEIAPDDWQTVLSGNLTSAFLGARSQIPLMLERGGGSIVFTSTFVGTSVGIPGMSVYGTSKAA